MTSRPPGDCSINETPSDQFFARLSALPAGPSDLPLAGSIELTHHCNLRCPHCYLPVADREPELSSDDWIHILDRLSERGVLFLLLTGGDPLLRNDFRIIYEAAHTRGFVVTLFTNGTLLTDANIAVLARRPPRRVELTVYGTTAGTWDTVTGTKGSFPDFERGLRRLAECGIGTALKMLVLRDNHHEMESARRLAESLGASIRFDPIVTARLDGDTTPTHLRIDAHDAASMWFGSAEPSGSPAAAPHKGPIPLFRCGAGTRTFNIDPTGTIHPCLMWRKDGIPFLDSDPSDWRRVLNALRDRYLPSDAPCAHCDIRPQCPACPAISQLETGRADAPVPFFCSMAKDRV
jgi:radical SAM protein with 4Fe4S-binding SPASM domain